MAVAHEQRADERRAVPADDAALDAPVRRLSEESDAHVASHAELYVVVPLKHTGAKEDGQRHTARPPLSALPAAATLEAVPALQAPAEMTVRPAHRA